MEDKLNELDLRIAAIERERGSKILAKPQVDYLKKVLKYILCSRKDFTNEGQVLLRDVNRDEFRIMMSYVRTMVGILDE